MQLITRNIVLRIENECTQEFPRQHAQLFWIFFLQNQYQNHQRVDCLCFSVPCLKYCRSVQELWDSVHCINHIGLFRYRSGVYKSRE